LLGVPGGFLVETRIPDRLDSRLNVVLDPFKTDYAIFDHGVRRPRIAIPRLSHAPRVNELHSAKRKVQRDVSVAHANEVGFHPL
jgi:hypothetical protein